MQFPGIVTRAVKRGGADPEVCHGLDAESGRRETARGVAEAIEAVRSRRMPPYKPAVPMTVTLRHRTMDAAAKAALKPGVLRLDDHTVEARVGRQADIIKWITGAGLEMPA
jgi:D-aminopeptidase